METLPQSLAPRMLTCFQPMYQGSAAVLRKRSHRLQITDAQLRQCHTIGEVQSLARARYPSLVRRYHPDLHPMTRAGGRAMQGVTLGLILKTYRWLMGLAPGEQVQWVSTPLPRWEPEPLRLPWGWQETWW